MVSDSDLVLSQDTGHNVHSPTTNRVLYPEEFVWQTLAELTV
jgi:hypothetical protein